MSTETSTGAAPKRRRGNLLPAVVVAVGLAVGGYLMGSGGASSAAAADPDHAVAEEEHTEPEPEPEPGEVLALEPITLNLADGRYLKLGLALQLALEEGGGHGEAMGPEAARGFAAKALDETITVLGARRYEELVVPGGREVAKEELSRRVAERYDGKVLGVYFTQFVMQ